MVGESHPEENLLSTCSKGKYKLSHWGSNEAIRCNCDGFLMRLSVLGQQLTLVLSQTQEKDGETSRQEENRGGAGAWSWLLASRLHERS